MYVVSVSPMEDNNTIPIPAQPIHIHPNYHKHLPFYNERGQQQSIRQARVVDGLREQRRVHQERIRQDDQLCGEVAFGFVER
jgi:hypothetical protein